MSILKEVKENVPIGGIIGILAIMGVIIYALTR